MSRTPDGTRLGAARPSSGTAGKPPSGAASTEGSTTPTWTRLAGRRRASTAAVAALILAATLTVTHPGWAVEAELAVVRAYRATLSPLMAHVAQCRYEPTCSRYALDALQERGFWRGNLAIATRLLRCSPVGAVAEALQTPTAQPGA